MILNWRFGWILHKIMIKLQYPDIKKDPK